MLRCTCSLSGGPMGSRSFDLTVQNWMFRLHNMYSGSKDFNLFDDRAVVFLYRNSLISGHLVFGRVTTYTPVARTPQCWTRSTP